PCGRPPRKSTRTALIDTSDFRNLRSRNNVRLVRVRTREREAHVPAAWVLRLLRILPQVGQRSAAARQEIWEYDPHSQRVAGKLGVRASEQISHRASCLRGGAARSRCGEESAPRCGKWRRLIQKREIHARKISHPRYEWAMSMF